MNNLSVEIRKARSLSIFKTSILSKKKKVLYFLFMTHLVQNFLTRLRLKSSHLNEYKFRLGFNDTINPMCACGTDVETTEHFLLRCHFYSTLRVELFENLEKIEATIFRFK